MYFNDNERHFTPHLHVFYAEFQAAIDFNARILRGNLPKTAHELVKKWMAENRNLLNYSWEMAKMNKPIPKIKGLK